MSNHHMKLKIHLHSPYPSYITIYPQDLLINISHNFYRSTATEGAKLPMVLDRRAAKGAEEPGVENSWEIHGKIYNLGKL